MKIFENIKGFLMKTFENIKGFLIDLINLEAFQHLEEKSRETMIKIIKFQIEIIAIFIVIYGLFREPILTSLFETTRTDWLYAGLVAYLSQIALSVLYIVFAVLVNTYLSTKKLYEVTQNISYIIIFFEIISSMFFIGFVFLGTERMLEYAFVLVLTMYFALMIVFIVLERLLDKEEIDRRKQKEKERFSIDFKKRKIKAFRHINSTFKNR